MIQRYLLAPLLTLLLLAAPHLAHAQTGGVRIGTAGAPDASAVLDVSSSTKGLLPPRLSVTQRDAIPSPAAGLTIYNTTTNRLNTWNGTSWEQTISATESPISYSAQTFATPGQYSYLVPPGVTTVLADVSGAKGGSLSQNYYPGGAGSRVLTALAVTPGDLLIVTVGGAGQTVNNQTGNNNKRGGGGFNGGGNGYGNPYGGGAGGGGASDIRRGSTLLVVAGGGGASFFDNPTNSFAGGAGGYPTGATGANDSNSAAAMGGTQMAGGVSNFDNTTNGSQGQGGSGAYTGGGGGYYGGAGGPEGAGGGSSYTNPNSTSGGSYSTASTPTGDGRVTLTPGPFSTVSISNPPGDNLGNHTATQNLNLSSYKLVGNGGSAGLTIDASGTLGVGSMAGTGTRMVTTDASGNLLPAALPTDAQQLSISGSTLSLTNGGSVTVPSTPGDNLGNHTATQKIDLATFPLVGNGGSAGLTISSSGNVGIGTNSTPSQKLEVAGGILASSNGLIRTQGAHLQWNRSGNEGETWLLNQQGGGNGNAGIRFGSATTANATTEWARFLNNGNLGLGTTAPLTRLSISQVTAQGNTAGQNLGELSFVGFNRPNPSASIQALTKDYDDTGLLLFKTSPSGAGATERMRITADGNVGIGTTDPKAGLHIDRPESSNTTTLGVLLSGGSSGNPSIELRGTNNALPYLDFVENAGLDYSTRLISQAGTLSLQYGGTATKPSYILNVQGGLQCVGTVNTSDQRLKQHVRPIGSALASVLALRGVRYEWNTLGVQHGGKARAEQVGVIAQEVEKVFPELVSTGPDGYKAVNYAQLTPVLIEAIKELAAQNEALKARTTSAEAQAAQATATLETFEARLRRLEAATGGADPAAQAHK
jgi:hypothetical protein